MKRMIVVIMITLNGCANSYHISNTKVNDIKVSPSPSPSASEFLDQTIQGEVERISDETCDAVFNRKSYVNLSDDSLVLINLWESRKIDTPECGSYIERQIDLILMNIDNEEKQ